MSRAPYGIEDVTGMLDTMDRCAFCPKAAPAMWAMTACNSDSADSASWRREILPRCEALITQAGDKGRVVKATGERWFGGHTVGWPKPKWTPNQEERT